MIYVFTGHDRKTIAQAATNHCDEHGQTNSTIANIDETGIPETVGHRVIKRVKGHVEHYISDDMYLIAQRLASINTLLDLVSVDKVDAEDVEVHYRTPDGETGVCRPGSSGNMDELPLGLFVRDIEAAVQADFSQ
jgi:hypothetical protein